MRTFEKAYKDIFKDQLSKFIDKDIFISNDINYKPLEKNSNALVAIIKTGPGTKQNRAGIDLTNVVFNISLILNANDVQSILGAISSLTFNYNAVWSSVIIPVYDVANKETIQKTFQFAPIFTNPFVLGDTYDLKIDKETIKAATLMMSVSVSYSSNSSTAPRNFWLSLEGTKRKLNYTRYDVVNTPIYDPVYLETKENLTRNIMYTEVAYNFTIIKVEDDALHYILESECMSGAIQQTNFKSLELEWQGSQGTTFTSSITEYGLSMTYENGVTVITLTLKK